MHSTKIIIGLGKNAGILNKTAIIATETGESNINVIDEIHMYRLTSVTNFNSHYCFGCRIAISLESKVICQLL